MPLPRRARLLATGTAVALDRWSAPHRAAGGGRSAGDRAGTQAAPGRYIVTLKGSPIATYAGEVKGLKATRPTKGRKVNARSADAKAYRKYLERQQDRAAARVGAKADRHFAVALNGFTTTLTAAQARTAAAGPGRAVGGQGHPPPADRRQEPGRLPPAERARTASGRRSAAQAKAGRGVVVGVLDSGYWPENPSFAGRPAG